MYTHIYKKQKKKRILKRENHDMNAVGGAEGGMFSLKKT